MSIAPSARPTGAVHPTLEAFVEPLVETGFEVGILPSRHRVTSETLYVRRDGNCGYICVEDLYSDTGVIVCFQIAPSRRFGSGILVSAPWREGDPETVEELVAAAKVATEPTITDPETGTVLENLAGGTTAWQSSAFERLDGGEL